MLHHQVEDQACPPARKEKALDKLLLDGDFGVEDARFTDPEIRSQLASSAVTASANPTRKTRQRCD